MKTVLFVALVLYATSSIASKIEVTCWSGDKIIFNERVKEAVPGEQYTVVSNGKSTSVITGDCVIKYSK